ncbi:tyrosine-protein phosphatase [Arthrobacter sp. zg-Y238]|uniref:tyrosine-protein phosphatase n=1 Tax=Arthrobacter sp. zg-Y238 TaxID=2964614 RepID=UPI002107D71D|nr:tyrosine-protein phosphatase [Arthrobacter sp. zg-Y238]MCQ1953216.1 tyrosine-protein phosphatase [Arthrobacter sp. zg-Y238]
MPSFPETAKLTATNEAPGTPATVEGLVNFRDLGGRRRRDGTLTPHGVFFRSETVDLIRPGGWDTLYALGVRTVVDLRQPPERARDTTARPDWLTTVPVDLDGLAENPEFWEGYWDNGLMGTPLYFLPHLTRLPDRMGAVLTALAGAPEGGVLFHCMAGRDRTGMTAMVLLAAVDAEPEEIREDYFETVRNADAFAAATGRPNPEAQSEKLCAEHGTSMDGALRAAVDGFSLQRLFDDAGLPEAVRTGIRTWRGAVTAEP